MAGNRAGRGLVGRRAPPGEGTAGPSSSLVKLSMRALQLKDRSTYEHSVRVAHLATVVGRTMGAQTLDLDRLWTAALLHDVGKLYLSDRLLQTSGVLDTSEFQEVREHAVVGFELLRVVPELAAYARLVRHHHERWDGRGYPDQLAGESIPLEARLICAADALDVMVQGRSYRAARPVVEVVGELEAEGGRQFDPRVVAALVRAWRAGRLNGVDGPGANGGRRAGR